MHFGTPSVPAFSAVAFPVLSFVRFSCGLFLRLICLVLVGLLAGCRGDAETEETRAGAADAGASTGRSRAEESVVRSPAEIKASLRRGNLRQAEEMVAQALRAQPEEPILLALAGDVAGQQKDSETAAKFYSAALDRSSDPEVEWFNKLGQEWMNLGRPFDSIAVMERGISRFPELAGFRIRLVGLQAAMGMEYEARQHLQWLVQRGHGNLDLLIILSDLSRPQTVESTCQFALENYPQDLRPQYGLARLPSYHSEWKKVLELLEPVVQRHPEFVPASAWYGRALVETGKDEGLEEWRETLPEGIKAHPQYWIALGTAAESEDQYPMAARAYRRAVQMDPDNGEALQKLAAVLSRLGRAGDASPLAKRAAKLTSVRDRVDSLLASRKNSQTAAVAIAQDLDALGRRWEATTWLQAAYPMTQNLEGNLDSIYKQIRAKLTGSTPWQIADALSWDQVDLTDYPAPQWPTRTPRQTTEGVAQGWIPTEIRYVDQAQRRNLNHTCLNQRSGEGKGLRIFESGAGGVGVIDFDLDGRPDLYFSATNGTPLRRDSDENRLFRNLGETFADVTGESAAGDRGYAQGIAVGDYNSDGFPDLFVANIGRNQLLRNNGDGTFTNVTEAVGLKGNQWTTSAAICDLNGDGIADLFQLGYCQTEDSLTQLCIDSELKEPRSCAPLAFSAQPDSVWEGGRSGEYTDASQDWLAEHEPGRGMGVVVGELDGQPGLDILVANDMTANHFWSRGGLFKEDQPRDSAEANEGGFRLLEQAGIRGLAVNARSISQASMGIAAGDSDADGDVDFVLTHFSGDHHTFYEQVSQGMWSDQSKRAGLLGASDPMLGYGTQWIDADHDGRPELFVANGDIDDFTHKGRVFEQRAEMYEPNRSGEWSQLNPEALGSYFETPHLGRSVVTVDANGDGKTDLVVTHLFEPVSLLINETPVVGKGCRFFLVGTDCHRDAIGARLTMQRESGSQVGWLFAGDGYHGSNQRCVDFGRRSADINADLQVRWPDGKEESFGQQEWSGDYLLIQGSGIAVAMDPN